MTHSAAGTRREIIARMALVVIASMLPLLLSGCGGTQVYNTQKSVIYNGNLYNVSNVKVVSSSVTANFDNGTVLDLENVNKKMFINYESIYGPLPVRMVIMLDGQELVYAAWTTKNFTDFDQTRKRFGKATQSIGKFMADRKKTQLKLK